MNNRPLLLFAAITLVPAASPANQDNTVAVEGRVLHTRAYCGGAAPRPEMLDELRKPVPDPEHKVYFKRGAKNSKAAPVASAAADAKGQVAVRLAPGTYCVVDDEKSAPLAIPANDANTKFDRACLKKNWSRCDAVIQVKPKSTTRFEVTFPEYCVWTRPCQEYHGPLPP